MNYLTKKQLSIIVFFVPLVFKMALLPSLLYKESGADSYISIAVIATVEFLQMGLVLFVASKGGMHGIKELYGQNVQRILALPLVFVMGVKCVVFITEIYTYVCDYLFYNISVTPVIILLLLVFFYLALKGVKTIGRLFELAIWLIPIIVLFGVIFGKVTLYPQYLTPLFENGASGFFGGLDKYILYAFDFSPLLFFKIEKKKNVRIIISSVLCVIALTGCYIVLIASYGRATFLVNSAFARLASFNTVISEIGSLDWPSILLWLTTSICTLALKFAAMGETVKYFNIKKSIGLGGICIVIGILLLWVFPGLKDAIRLATSAVRYVVIGIELAIPIIMLALFGIKQNNIKEAKLETTV